MSSMRNAVQRRNHKERAQPLERQKWGLLEKKKDYTLRAKDHNDKKRRLKLLRNKASERNPDEFAFGMMSSTTKKGIKVSTRGRENGTEGPMSDAVAKLLKTQDLGYLNTVLQQTKKARARVEKDLVLARTGVDVKSVVGAGANKIVFDEEGEEVPVLEFEGGQEMDLDDLEELGDLSALDGLEELEDLDDDDDGASGSGSDNESQDDNKGLTKEEVKTRRKRKRNQEILQTHLDTLTDREQHLTFALAKLEEQRARMNHTIGGVNKNGVKFKVRERKR